MNAYSKNHAGIALLGVTRTFKKDSESISLFERLDLSIAGGEFTAIMGPSGSGKSTLLNMFAGFDRPTTGEIRIDGIALNELDEAQMTAWRSRCVGFVFQSYNLIPVLTAAENVELPLLALGMPKAARRLRVAAALQLVNLSERMKHFPRELSGGQQQRVSIARAIVSDPTLLLCDEPTGDLDAAASEDVLDLLRQLSVNHGKTIVMVTHDHRAVSYASKLLNLDKGVLHERSLNA